MILLYRTSSTPSSLLFKLFKQWITSCKAEWNAHYPISEYRAVPHKAPMTSSEPLELKTYSTLSITLKSSRVMGKIYSENVKNGRWATSNCFHKNIWTKIIAIWTGSALSTLRLQSRQLHTHVFYCKWCNQLLKYLKKYMFRRSNKSGLGNRMALCTFAHFTQFFSNIGQYWLDVKRSR